MTKTVASIILSTATGLASADPGIVDAPGQAVPWPSKPPAGCPFPPSELASGLRFTGRHARYTSADTWYPSWASDDKMYSPWTDGTVNHLRSNSAGKNATTGHATISGDDPLKLVVTDQALYASDPSPFQSRYPCGSLVHNGIWYYGTYCLGGGQVTKHNGVTYNWPWLGAFVGFRHSTDFGKTWTQTPCTPAKPLFGESGLQGEPVKIGAPHFVDFGKNMEHSPDGKAYLVAHGASDGQNRRFGYNSWITGDEIYLVRVTPGIDNINDASKYEFWDGTGWTGDFAKIKPIAAWRDKMGCVTMIYNAPLRKYLMCITDGETTGGYFHSYLLESNAITGPFKMVQYMARFGEQGYFLNIPSKFISKDGWTMWLSYSANFAATWDGKRIESKPPGSRYAMCLQEFRLDSASEPVRSLPGADNIAAKAKITASSVQKGYTAAAATDGTVAGYPGDITREWASNSETAGASLRLEWDREQLIDCIWLFDRPNTTDQVTAGKLAFSDGTEMAVDTLPDDARQGIQVIFPPKKVQWLAFTVTAVKPGSPNIGLSEIGVFSSQGTKPASSRP
jgi:hypothetical protein